MTTQATGQTTRPIRLQTNIFRGCHRCGGTLHLERDLDPRLAHESINYVCLQCGRHTPFSVVMEQVRESLEGAAA
jgi:RNase P subunit RPR2